MENWFLLKIGSFGGWFSSIFGSLLALYFSRSKVAKMNKLEIAFVFIAGVLIGHWIGGGLVDYYNIKPTDGFVADSIKIISAVTGMGLLARLHAIAPDALDRAMNRDK